LGFFILLGPNCVPGTPEACMKFKLRPVKNMKGQSCFAYAGPALTQRLTSTQASAFATACTFYYKSNAKAGF
jgi:hypothetical protein